MTHDAAVARRLADTLAAEHGLRFTPRSRFASGLQGGAWLLVADTGARAVLKWSSDWSPEHLGRVADTVDRLRDAGHPTPPILATGAAGGHAYYVQAHAAGVPSTPLDSERTELLLDVLERQRDLEPLLDNDYRDHVRVSVADESAGSLRSRTAGSGPAGRALVDRYDAVLAGVGDVALPHRDVVHGDFNSCNILLHGGRVSGVVDVAGMGRGTRVFDYACLLREAYVEGYGDDVTRRIHTAAEKVAGPDVLAVCAAAAAFFIVPFKQAHQPGALDRTVARLHRMADALSAR
ncbi:MAG TPA: phosphotransferase [Streptosporangiales bacterium]